MNNLNMRRILKTPTLRMAEGGEGEPLDDNDPRNFWPGQGAAPRVQVPQGANMGRNQYLMRNPGALANQTASPSPGQLPFSHIPALMNAPGPGFPAQPSAVPTPNQSAAETLRLARSGTPATPIPNESAAETSRLARSGTPTPAAPAGFSPLRNNPTVLSNGKGSFGDAAGLAAAPSNYSGPTAGGTPGNPTASTIATMDALVARQPGKQLADAQMAAVTRPSTGMNNYTGSSAPAVPPAVRQSVQQSFTKPSSGFGAVTLREGGSPAIDRGMGGNVPGEGKGDKIPAKYEPGEFVVSNAMLDASPGLREELHDLRGNVLAQKGMTPAEADAKAMGYSGSPQGEDDGHQAQGNAVVARSAGSNLRNNPATDFRRNQGGGKTPELTIHAFDSFVSDRVPDAYGSSTIAGEATADQKLAAAARTAAQNQATARAAAAAAGSAPTITATATPAGSASFQAGQRVGQASKAAGFAEAGAGKALGLTGPFVEAAVDTQDKPIEDYRRRFNMDLNQTHDDGTTGGRLRQAGSDYGVRLAGVVQDGGAKILDLPVNTLNAGLRFFGGKGDVSLPGGSFTDYLQQNDNPEIHKRVMSQQEGYVPPATTNAAQPATTSVANSTPSLRPADPTLAPEPQIDWNQRKADRDALTQKDIALGDKMEATRLAREQAHWGAMDVPQRGEMGYAAHMARKNAIDLQQMQSDSLLRGHQISAEAQMYGSKLSNQLGRYNALREQSNADRTFAAGRYDADMINAGKSEDAARGAFKNRFDTTDKDGKVVARPDLESAAHEEAMRQSNGKWGTLTPAERAKNLSDAFDHIKLISSAREHQNNSVLQTVGILPKDAPHGRMPSSADLKGAQLTELGVMDGATSMNVGRGDYRLTTKSGQTMHFGRKDLSDDQLGYLERHGVVVPKGQ